jgi:Flp pilus assembly protein TadD
VLGDSHLDTADSLNELGMFYALQGDYEKAKPLLEEAMVMRKRVLGEDNTLVAQAKKDYEALLAAFR